MLIYIIFFLLTILMMINLDNSRIENNKEQQEKRYLKIGFGALILISALRGSSVGADTISYMNDYSFILKSSFRQVIERYEIGSGYYILAKIFSFTRLNVHWWFGVVTLVYCYSIFKLFVRLSDNPLYSLLCFVGTGLFSFSLPAGKQCLGMAFITLAFLALIDKKNLLCILLTIIAYWCHHVSIIFVFAAILWKIKDKFYYYPVCVGFMLLAFFSGQWFWETMISSLDNDHYTDLYLTADNVYSSTTFIFYLVLVLIAFTRFRPYTDSNKAISRLCYGGSLLAVSFQSLATSFSTAFRIANFFVPFLCILLPNCFHKKNASILFYFVLALVLFYFIYTERNSSYIFFWQG